MKIVKKGRDPSKDIYHVKCPDCESVIEFLKNDEALLCNRGDYFDPTIWSITCPLCQEYIRIDCLRDHLVGNEEADPRINPPDNYWD